jgi:uncharacterized protein YlaI
LVKIDKFQTVDERTWKSMGFRRKMIYKISMSTHCKVRVEASQTKKGLKPSSIHLSPMVVAQLSPFISKSTPPDS